MRDPLRIDMIRRSFDYYMNLWETGRMRGKRKHAKITVREPDRTIIRRGAKRAERQKWRMEADRLKAEKGAT